MNLFEGIKEKLSNHKSAEVDIYINYLRGLINDPKTNGWASKINGATAVSLFEKVAIDNLFIDGDTITLSFRGKILISYNYQAYKNRLLNIYPDAKFDVQLVHKGDDFSFRKTSGRVEYDHDINNPFETNKVTIGCYCIIKTPRGEFIETLNMDDIAKMRNVAKTQAIWNQWEGEMILKSVIKRACKRHFKDLVTNIEEIDNNNYDLTTTKIEHTLKSKIEECKSLEELQMVYDSEKNDVEDEPTFIRLITERRLELSNELKSE